MDVILPFRRPRPLHERSDHAETLDHDGLALFLRVQASWLTCGLAGAEDAHCRRLVLAAHDAAHDRWVSLIAAVGQTRGDALAREVATLYAFSGRVAATIERGPDPLLPPDIGARLRALLAQRLHELTHDVATQLDGDGPVADAAG